MAFGIHGLAICVWPGSKAAILFTFLLSLFGLSCIHVNRCWFTLIYIQIIIEWKILTFEWNQNCVLSDLCMVRFASFSNFPILHYYYYYDCCVLVVSTLYNTKLQKKTPEKRKFRMSERGENKEREESKLQRNCGTNRIK